MENPDSEIHQNYRRYLYVMFVGLTLLNDQDWSKLNKTSIDRRELHSSLTVRVRVGLHGSLIDPVH